jgi:dihydroorotate dehydrogenase (fumarate)
MANLTTQYMGLQLSNPIIAASSGLTDNIENLVTLERNGIAAVVLKSLFEEEILHEMEVNLKQQSSEKPMFPESLDYYEYLDYPKESPEQYIELIEKAKAKLKIPVIASINCISPGQWTLFPKRIEKAGADAIELNLFIVSSDPRFTAEENEKRYISIIREVKSQVNIPVALKVSYYFSNLERVLLKFAETGINGLVLFNRFYSPDVDINKIELIPGFITSSPSDLSISMRWIALISKRVRCSLAASTGVHNGQALIKQLLVGANVVQIASALYKYGPGVIKEMTQELSEWMEKNKYTSIDEFRGKLSHNPKDISTFERFQFMKHSREYQGQNL